MAHIPAYHNFQLNHPNPNSICVACGYLCLTQQYTCTTCNVYVHVECLTGPLRKPVPLCSRPLAPSPAASAPSWTTLGTSSTHPIGYHPQQPAHGMPPYGPYNHQGYTQNTGNGSTGMKYFSNSVADIGVRLISSLVMLGISDSGLPDIDPFGGS